MSVIKFNLLKITSPTVLCDLRDICLDMLHEVKNLDYDKYYRHTLTREEYELPVEEKFKLGCPYFCPVGDDYLETDLTTRSEWMSYAKDTSSPYWYFIFHICHSYAVIEHMILASIYPDICWKIIHIEGLHTFVSNKDAKTTFDLLHGPQAILNSSDLLIGDVGEFPLVDDEIRNKWRTYGRYTYITRSAQFCPRAKVTFRNLPPDGGVRHS